MAMTVHRIEAALACVLLVGCAESFPHRLTYGTLDSPAMHGREMRYGVEHHVPHEALEFDGDHSWRSWGPAIEEALRRMVEPSPWARPPADQRAFVVRGGSRDLWSEP